MQTLPIHAAKTELQLLVRGLVYAPGDASYESEAAAFNLATRHTPDLVLTAVNADDVVAAVRWASARNMSISVQSTGHGAANAIADGLLISTRYMMELSIDPEEQTARVGAGVRWRDVLHAAAPHGLTGLHGSTTDVGVVGYTLGGGLPLLGRKYGFASDHVLAFDLVTPDGELRRVDAVSDPSLFSLLRGGKGNPGTVTAMEFYLFPAAELYAGGVFYEGAHARDVLASFRNWTQDLPSGASASLAFLRLPDLEEVPGFLRGKFVMHLRFAWQGSEAEGSALLAPMRAAAPVLVDTAGPLPYNRVDEIHADPQHPVPVREGGMLLKGFGPGLEDVLLDLAGPESRAPLLLTEIRLMGGALADPLTGNAPGADCLGGRDAGLSFFTVGIMAPPIAELVADAIEGARTALKPCGTGGSLVNLHGHLASPELAVSAWPEEARERMSAAKAELDPKNLFRHGHAVLPLLPEAAAVVA
ncbi:FAD-binding oxidoreductase [Pseudarthrobacter sp. NS4]|uniref:FAD-binding oxidoreductase n=1 Tax=Pseudarthrobacter sp. NS4 TaxID=2973976 RepID=UPI0021624577|nr:FAD-binding oxidoreductase [Pseudarthrobacter sp. NS4]